MKKKIILFVIALFIFPLNIFAKPLYACNSSELSRLKKYASNVNISYNYFTENNEAYFNVTINNVTPDMYIEEETTGQKYYYNHNNNQGEIVTNNFHDVTSLKFVVYSNTISCTDEVLTVLYVNLPIYNKYADDPLCENNKNFRLCKRFLTSNISREYFEKEIQEYIDEKNKNNDSEIEEEEKHKNFDSWQDLLIRYSPLAVILLIVLIVYLVQRRKKNSFDFKL